MPTIFNPLHLIQRQCPRGNAVLSLRLWRQAEYEHLEEYHAAEDPAEGNKIMHAQLETPNGIIIMGADTPNSMPYENGSRISVTLSGADEAELRGYYDQFCQGGNVVMPLEKAPWGDHFGMVTDKYGVLWQVNISGNQAMQS